MHTVYLGYSSELTGQELIRYFDIDPDHAERLSKFEQVFGCNYVEPGSFEVYGCEDYQGLTFDENLLLRLLPFAAENKFLASIDFNFAKSVFYVETSSVKVLEGAGIKLIGPMSVKEFDFE